MSHRYIDKIKLLVKQQRIDPKIHILFITHSVDCRFILEIGECNCFAAIEAGNAGNNGSLVGPELKAKLVEEEGFQILHGQAVNGERYYEPPLTNLNCYCYPNMMQAMFCMQGHMTECHAGKTCSEARCSHLNRYYE